MAESSAGAARLRGAIDSGRTGDKVDWNDPAAAPLGTDDEAAGTPPTAARTRIALEQEVRPDLDRPQTRGPGAAWVLIACVVFFAIGMFALVQVF